MLPVVFRLEARAEFDEAIEFLNRRSVGAGVDFLTNVYRVLSQVAAHPEMFATTMADVRKVDIRKSDYLLLYQIKPRWIEVVSVFHGSRDPSIWQRRI